MDAKEILLKILDKQEEFNKDMSEVKVTLARQEENLAEHMRRTQLNEENIELLRREFKKDMDPVTKHVAVVNAGLRLIGGLAVVVSIITGIMQIFRF